MTTLPSRQVHLDFHTSPLFPDVGSSFDGEAFGAALTNAKVNSITLFAKCHHGMLYYNTPSPARHPTLRPGFDLLASQIDACRRRNIRTPIYLSVMCDEFAANEHKDWIAVSTDGSTVGRKPLAGTPMAWQILDMSSPYADYLAEQIEEVVKLFKPVDGIFLDMCWDQVSVSKWALAGMAKMNLNPTIEADRNHYARAVVHGYMKRYNDIIAGANGSLPRVFYNSRPKLRLVDESHFLQHVEIEALPTGGWGYTYFPLNVRFARNFGLPYLGMTGRFHRSWSDFGGFKPTAALKYECAQILAHGATCSVGDQLHPSGTLDGGAYALIGEVYKHVEACEPFCLGALPVTEIGVLRDIEGVYHVSPGDALEGIVRLLQQTFHQFDFIHAQSDLTKYKVIVIPNQFPLTEAMLSRLQSFADAGGKLVVAGQESLEAIRESLRKSIGVNTLQPHQFKTVFLRCTGVDGVLDTDHVLYDPTAKLTPTSGGTGFGTIVEPYFDREWNHFSGHNQTPPATATNTFAAVTGAGGAAFGFDLFHQYAKHGNVHLRHLFAAVMRRVLPEPLVRSSAPTHVELSLTQLGDSRIVHVLSYAPQRRTPDLDLVEEATPLIGAKISVRAETKPTKVTTQPTGASLAFAYDAGYAHVELTSDRGHDMIVIE